MADTEIIIKDRDSDYNELLRQVGEALQKGREKLDTKGLSPS